MRPDTSRLIHSDPAILGGTPVFVDTRVPVQVLLDHLEGGHLLEEFRSVERVQAVALLELARELLLAQAPAA